ncbi:MAG: hypothetical protein ACRDXX_22420 [Stackebrandtia sp.]
MSISLSRRTLIAGVPAAGLAATLPLTFPRTAVAAESAYAAFRVVRVQPGEPERPEITLPDGYAFVSGDEHSTASRAEYYTFVEGPPTAEGIEVSVRWPGVPVETVVHQEEHLSMRPDPDDPFAFAFTLPVVQASVGETQPTIQVWSFPDLSAGMYWRIEHNDADRAAGAWAELPWPEGETASVINYLVAAHAITRDSGLVDTAVGKGHRFANMGFETNNTLHLDNPPHWHLSYNSGPDWTTPYHNPHFYLGENGACLYNVMSVYDGNDGEETRYDVGEPAPMYDFAGDGNDGKGELVVTYTVRADGGLDVAPPDGPAYAIAPGANGDFVDEVLVLRADEPWLRVATFDEVRAGVLTVEIEGLQDSDESRFEIQRYDRLTGELE